MLLIPRPVDSGMLPWRGDALLSAQPYMKGIPMPSYYQ
jgi:hypothetical protein